MDLNVGDKVYVYEIKLDFKENRVEQTKLEHNIIGVNKERVCIDNCYFTSIKTKKDYRGDTDTLFNQIGIIDTSKWGWCDYADYISGTLYTTNSSNKVAYKRIKKELEKYINEKISRYGVAIELLEKIDLSSDN